MKDPPHPAGFFISADPNPAITPAPSRYFVSLLTARRASTVALTLSMT
jgi:hypothetical protein